MKRKILAGIVILVSAAGSAHAQSALTADGVVESTAGGFKFPDGSVQASAAVAGSAPVEDTGVDGSQCWDNSGVSRPCVGTGEDGELQAGVPAPTPRFTDNGDGTVTDNLTGLVWLKDANCPGLLGGWQAILTWVASFNTTSIACTDYTAMTFTDWRLPNVKELSSLIDFGESSPALTAGHPFVNVLSAEYASSTTSVSNPGVAWSVDIGVGDVLGGVAAPAKASMGLVWPVRGGQ